MKLNSRSLKRLEGVHPDLVRVVLRAAEAAPEESFIVTEGLRTVERQKQLFKEGKSKTMHSRHIAESNACKMGCAVDLAVWHDKNADKVVDVDELSWKFMEYKLLADLMKDAARIEGVQIEWGGDWKFKDGPHFQLPWATYP